LVFDRKEELLGANQKILLSTKNTQTDKLYIQLNLILINEEFLKEYRKKELVGAKTRKSENILRKICNIPTQLVLRIIFECLAVAQKPSEDIGG
jgi:hypothetical protein